MLLTDVEIQGPVATLTLRRPEARNALSIELCDAIVSRLEEINEDPAARVVIIAGEGKVFCSGADFAAVSGPGALDFLPAFERMLEAVAHHRLPTIACIHGAALGGGLQLATVCDFRIVADDARLGIPSSRLGIVVNFENVQRLVLLAGIARAKEVLMTARSYTGSEAVEAGLATRAYPAGISRERSRISLSTSHPWHRSRFRARGRRSTRSSRIWEVCGIPPPSGPTRSTNWSFGPTTARILPRASPR